jgi:hypothetical protein
MVALAWIKLYGFPFDSRIWMAFIVHDWGYWGCRDIDGPEGKFHPYHGGILMGEYGEGWFEFTAYHSRSFAKWCGSEPSKLCAPDKLASALVPRWLYILMTTLSGEIEEFMDHAAKADPSKVPMALRIGGLVRDKKLWHRGAMQHLREAAQKEAKRFQ